MKEILLGIIGVVIMILLFPMVLSATHSIQAEERTDSLLTITANKVTLTKDLWNDDTDSVLSIVGGGTEAPGVIVAVSYTPTTRQLTLGGVTDSDNATVAYEVDRLTSYMGMGALVGMTPLLLWLGLLGASVFGIYTGFRKR